MSVNRGKGVFLDVDPSIVENSLRFTNDANEEEFNKIFKPPSEQQYTSKVVKPFPGFCIKTKEIGTDRKLFLNICHTEELPAPKDITERELKAILETDEVVNFRVPMSIGEPRNERDNKGNDAKVCDIAINTKFFEKIQRIQLFKDFLVTVVIEGVKDKYGIVMQDEKIILQNKKAWGTLQVHRIQQREMDEKMKPSQKQEQQPIIETLSSKENVAKVPEYRLFRRKDKPNCLIGEFKFPDVLSAKELALDLGEDRILIESAKRNYLLDIFIPHLLRVNLAASNFNKSTKILTVTMPIMGG